MPVRFLGPDLNVMSWLMNGPIDASLMARPPGNQSAGFFHRNNFAVERRPDMACLNATLKRMVEQALGESEVGPLDWQVQAVHTHQACGPYDGGGEYQGGRRAGEHGPAR
jgi:hypothetical protein